MKIRRDHRLNLGANFRILSVAHFVSGVDVNQLLLKHFAVRFFVERIANLILNRRKAGGDIKIDIHGTRRDREPALEIGQKVLIARFGQNRLNVGQRQ